jgi:hypothetical protein
MYDRFLAEMELMIVLCVVIAMQVSRRDNISATQTSFGYVMVFLKQIFSVPFD